MNLPVHPAPLSEDEENEENEEYDEEYDDEDSDDEPTWPKYTAEEIAAMFLDYYQFLTTLHYDAADLKIAPPGGWAQLTAEFCAGAKKTDFALEVMRQLPYFARKSPPTSFHTRSFLIDYSTEPKREFDEWAEYEETYYCEGENDEIGAEHVFPITNGHESAARMHFLNTRNGEIIDEQIRCATIGPSDIPAFFDDLKGQHRTLQLVSCLGRNTIEAEDVPEREGAIAEAEFLAQPGPDFGSHLDVQYMRQMLRKHGWPQAFRKDEAKVEIDALMVTLEERGRDTWEETDIYW